MIIDFHTHAFPDALAPRAIQSLSIGGGVEAFTDGTANGIIKVMDENSVDKAVVLNIATKPKQEANVNSFAISLLENPRFVPLGSVFPGSENALYEIDRLHEAGIKGIKLHPEYQDFFIDDKVAFPIYKACAKHGMFVHFHCGGDVAYSAPFHAEPHNIENTVSMFPETTFIAAHMGGYGLWERFADTVKAHDNLYIDTSMTNTVDILDNDTAKRIFEIHGFDKFLFGSDTPWERECKSLEKLYSYGFSDEVNKMILGENAKKLLEM